jgi:capsular exopolysaccharide synthesis family protein
MSRIHEALKKAEQQRAEQLGGYPPAEELVQNPTPMPASASAPAGESAPVESSAPASAPAAGRVAAPAMGEPFSYETLLANCAPSSWKPDLKTMLFFNPDEQTFGAEEFRTLRSRLYQMRDVQPLKKLLVTSSLPKEGKTFVSANLAQVMVQQHGRRALLIDADLRGARLHEALGTTSEPGVAEYLQGGVSEFSILQRGPVENLFFIPSGAAVSKPAELVANGRLRLLLNRLEPLFDWIVIDSPPAVPVSDASLLANYVDGVLIVVRSNATPFDAARRAGQEFAGKNIVGMVLNGISASSSPYKQQYYATYGRRKPSSNGQG